jgi:RNA polymerase sigma factor (TIGR02999 family)
MMRRILVNYAVRSKRHKRGNGDRKVCIDAIDGLSRNDNIDLIVLDEALLKLSKDLPLESRIVEMKFFGGLSTAETAKVLNVCERTVERKWRFARTWLLREIYHTEGT